MLKEFKVFIVVYLNNNNNNNNNSNDNNKERNLSRDERFKLCSSLWRSTGIAMFVRTKQVRNDPQALGHETLWHLMLGDFVLS